MAPKALLLYCWQEAPVGRRHEELREDGHRDEQERCEGARSSHDSLFLGRGASYIRRKEKIGTMCLCCNFHPPHFLGIRKDSSAFQA